MLNALSPLAKFCGVAALAVVGSGTLWLASGGASRVENRGQQAVSAPAVEQPAAEEASDPKPPLSTAESIALGRKLFLHEWTPNDPLAQGDGLGPMFNATACAACHGVGGLGGAGLNRDNLTMFIIVPGKGNPVHDGIIHLHSVNDLWTESLHDATAFLEHIDPALFRTASQNPRAILPGKLISTAVSTPALWGLGLIDKISFKELRGLSPRTASGRPRSLEADRIGKFGWKGQFATLRDFVASACATELGLSNSIRAQQTPGEYRENLKARQDLTDVQVQALTDFIASLPAPREVLPEDAWERTQVPLGRKVFDTVGCSACHTADVGSARGVYSDFRLHDVVDQASRLGEPYYQGELKPGEVQWPRDYPRPLEWKTPPLWGLADTAPYWHDGSAATIADAIKKHSQEAEACMSKYRKLSFMSRDALLLFLNTLKAPESVSPANPPPTAGASP